MICSKFITFVVEMTTRLSWRVAPTTLWFAQNSLPLWLKWQRWTSVGKVAVGCDLLKIHYLCGWNDNLRHTLTFSSWVVICSKFITFVVEMTTSRAYCCCWALVVICSKFITFVVEMTTSSILFRLPQMLWFAQNSVPLWLKWQPRAYCCCWAFVVICSKFITFVVEMTT